MSSLPTQPYSVTDFAGGLTENFIGGGPTRYVAADNLLVTVDRKLEERYGSQLYSYPQLPSGNSPVNALLPHDNEQYLFGVNCPNVYVLEPASAQVSLFGPTGNPPLAGGNYQNAISWGEWSHHTLMTNDSLNSTPIKIFRGSPYPTTLATAPTSNNNFMALTCGLPQPNGNQYPTQGVLLQNCITLANDLRHNMNLHFLNYGTYNTNLHQNIDGYGAGLLAGVPNATNFTTLIALVNSLQLAYTDHVGDVINNPGSPYYHFTNYSGSIFTANVLPTVLNYFLNNATAPTSTTTLTVIAGILDDLKSKFFMHQMAPFTHDQYNNYSITGQYLVTTPHIGTVSTGPIVTPSYAQTIALANLLKSTYNQHVVSGAYGYHMIPDTNDQVTFPDAVDLDSLYILIHHIRSQYSAHISDSALPHQLTTVSSTSGSPSLSSIVTSPGAVTYTPTAGNTIRPVSGFTFSVTPPPLTTVLSASSGACTASSNAGATTTGSVMDFTPAKYHITTNVDLAAEQLGGVGGGGQYTTYSPTPQNIANFLGLLTTVLAAYNAHDANLNVHESGFGNELQCVAVAPTISVYAYAIHYFYQYIRYDGVIFNTVGTPLILNNGQSVYTETIAQTQTTSISGTYSYKELPVTESFTQPASSVTITNIPTLTNGSQNNYDTANLQIKIFRTVNGATTLYNAGIIPNGQTTFTDSMPDVLNPLLPVVPVLSNQPTIYTSGGVVSYDPAPICKYVTVLNNTAYYGAVVQAGQTFLNRIVQGIQNSLDSAPLSFYVDVPDLLMGLSNTRNVLVALCKNSVYQVTGAFTLTGQGQMQYQSISDTIGCVSSASIVRTDVGIFFAGTDGFYYTDGFQLIKLSSELNLTYASLVSNSNQMRAIYGCYDKYNRRVWWTTQPNPSDWSATQSYIFHVNFGVTANGVFTTASNFENYRPSSMIFWQGQQIRGDARGYLFLHSNLSKTDPQVNTSTAYTAWNTVYIPYNYSSCAVDFGTTFNRKWLTRFVLQGKNVGNVGAQITSVSDNGRVAPLTMSPMWFHPNIIWGQPNIVWGKPNSQQPIVWNPLVEMDMWRRFPATQLRADYKQIKIQPAFIGVYRYQDWPVGAAATITPSGNGTASALILTPSGYTAIVWPSDIVGYTFSTQLDGFVKQYTITGLSTTTNTNDTLTVADPTNSLITTTVAWIIRGYLKQQRLSITSYNIHFTLLGKMQQAYHGSQDAGENAVGTSYSGGAQNPLTDNTGDPLTDNNGNPLTS